VQPQVVSPNRRLLYRLRGHRRLSRSSGQSPDHGCQMEDRQRSVHPVDRCGLLAAPGRPDFLPRGLPRTIDRFFAIKPPQTLACRLSAAGQSAEWHGLPKLRDLLVRTLRGLEFNRSIQRTGCPDVCNGKLTRYCLPPEAWSPWRPLAQAGRFDTGDFVPFASRRPRSAPAGEVSHPRISCRAPHVVVDPPWRATVLRAGALLSVIRTRAQFAF